MNINYPHTIENCIGEKLSFIKVQQEPDGERVLVENFVQKGCGPVMHTHLLQDEELTVVKGKLGYQVLGEPAKYAGPGESVRFNRGTPHRFWNAGDDILNCTGWIKPAHNVVYFLDAIYAAQNKSGNERPDNFDAAFLMVKYKNEYDMPEIPGFVKKVIIPITYFIGKITGKYAHFKNAPAPVIP